MGKTPYWLSALVLAACLGTPQSGAANGIAGDYLAARQASITGDFQAAAKYYGRAVLFDSANAEILERAILANISLGDLGRAAGLADKLVSENHASQIAFMARMARDAKDENYAALIAAIGGNQGAGPLADGMIKAWSLLGQGDMGGAIVGFDDVAKLQGLGPFSIYHKALALASVGDYENAAALLEGNAGQGLENTRRGIMARSEILSQLDRNNDAVTLIETAFRGTLDPGLQALYDALKSGDTLPFTHIRSARDGIAEVFYTLAGALANERNDELTLLYARLGEHLRPDHVEASILSAELLESLQQYDLAVAAYSAVPEEHPTYHAAALGQVGAFRAKGDMEAATEVAQSLVETHGHLPIVHSTLGDLKRQARDFEAATEAYTRAIELQGELLESNWFLLYARAITFERRDLWEQAEADFRAALELRPDQPQVLNYLGYSLVEKRIKLDEALEMIQRAAEASPDSGYIIDSLGWVLYRLGRYVEAVPHMERAAELMPIDPVVNDHLGDVYWSVGREIEAEFQWKRALSFATWEEASEEVDQDRIRRKLEVGLDQVLMEEGAPPLKLAQDDSN